MPDEPATPAEPPAPIPPTPPRRPGPASVTFWLCLAVAVGMALYRLIVEGRMEQSAVMFIGLPTALAILLSLTPTPKSATGVIMKGITLFLLMLGILFIEGFICILMAAPLFYTVGLVVGLIADGTRAKNGNKRLRLVAIPALALMSMEGMTGALSFPRDETITVSRAVGSAPAAARARLAAGPDFVLAELPLFLKAGFPAPRSVRGGGLEPGDEWRIHFAGGEGKPGDLTAQVVESSASRIVVARTGDTSHIAHWLDWRDATWTIAPEGAGSRVTLTVRYRRLLDPAWYFKPIERHGVRQAGEYFLAQTFKNP